VSTTISQLSSRHYFLAGISGLAGVILIITSFIINPGPPPGATLAQIEAFGQHYFSAILWGAWLQAVGPVFIMLFAFTIVIAAGAVHKLAGWMTFFGGCILMCVSLIEITFYIAVLFEPHALTTPIIMALIEAVQHLYFIVAAPSLFIPLGIVIITSSVLPRLFGYLAVIFGIFFAVIGMLTLLTLKLPPTVTMLGIIQGLWWLSAAITLIVRWRKGYFTANAL
jgi:hypothetical protein